MFNRISSVLEEEAINNINAALQVINDNLNMLVGLNKGESKKLQTIDSGRYLFVTKCFEFAETNPQFQPDFFDTPECKKDLVFFDQLWPFETNINQLSRKLTDTRILTGHEAYTFARAVYEKIKSGAQKGIPGFKAAYDELKPFFEKYGRKKKTANT
jgi:hypothetical protein